MINIIDYGSGNVSAIRNIYERLNIPYTISSNKSEIEQAQKLLLPGVGAFDTVMNKLNNSGLRDVIEKAVIANGVPILGICVGMQILFEKSEEGVLPGLGWLKGDVLKFDENQIKQKPKVPHLGWNSINIKKYQSTLFDSIDEKEGFYFIHSYYCKLGDHTISTTTYGEAFSSAVSRDNIIGVQFHPEKSHSNGIKLLKNFSEKLEYA